MRRKRAKYLKTEDMVAYSLYGANNQYLTSAQISPLVKRKAIASASRTLLPEILISLLLTPSSALACTCFRMGLLT